MGDLFFQYCRIPKSWVHGSIAGDMNWEMRNFRWNETFNREARMSHIFADIFYEPDSMVISRWNKAHELFIIMNIYDLIRFSNIFKYRTTPNTKYLAGDSKSAHAIFDKSRDKPDEFKKSFEINNGEKWSRVIFCGFLACQIIYDCDWLIAVRVNLWLKSQTIFVYNYL